MQCMNCGFIYDEDESPGAEGCAYECSDCACDNIICSRCGYPNKREIEDFQFIIKLTEKIKNHI